MLALFKGHVHTVAAATASVSAAESWLEKLRLGRFWTDFEILGVIDVEDYLLVEKSDLDAMPGMKPIHKRKFLDAVKRLEYRLSVSSSSPPRSSIVAEESLDETSMRQQIHPSTHAEEVRSNDLSELDPSSLSHATELMSLKLRRMRIGRLLETLADGTAADNGYETQARELASSLDSFTNIANSYGVDLNDATIEDLDRVVGDAQALEDYLIDLRDLKDLKALAELGVLGSADFNSLSIKDMHKFFEEPEVLQRIIDQNAMKDESQRSQNAAPEKHSADDGGIDLEKEAGDEPDRESNNLGIGKEAVTADIVMTDAVLADADAGPPETSESSKECEHAGHTSVSEGSVGGGENADEYADVPTHYSSIKFSDIDKGGDKLRRAEAHFQLGHMLHVEGQLKAAAEEYRRCLSIAPNHATATHMLAVVSDAEEYVMANPAYTEMLFDSYSDSYDEHMVKTLEYQVPQHMIKYVSALVGEENLHTLDILDCGCGTGLFGSLLRGNSEKPSQAVTADAAGFDKDMPGRGRRDGDGRLVGVDMSNKMLAKARLAGNYDDLIHSTISRYASSDVIHKSFDVIVVGDVFGYIGRLDNILPQLQSLLKPGGILAFTVELDDEVAAPRGYRLHEINSRFVHRRSYVKKVAEAAGLNEPVLEESVTLRLQMRSAVRGVLFAFQLPAGAL